MPFRLTQYLTRFRHDRRGNVAAIFAITAIPLISAIGCAVDYSLATRMKAKMQTAADAAGIAALSQKSPGFLAASVMTGNGSVTAGVTDANNVFDANMSGITGYQNLVRSSTVTKTGIKLAATVTYTADVPVSFLKVIGFQKLTVTGASSSAATLPPYLDFYLTLDVSGSMGLPSTAAEQTRLSQVNPDNYRQYPTGCTFACHFAPQNMACTNGGTQAYPTNNYCMGYAISRVSFSGYKALLSNVTANSTYPSGKKLTNAMSSGLPNTLYASLAAGFILRHRRHQRLHPVAPDAVGYAVNQLFVTANASKKVTNQFRIGLYPFIRYLYSYFPLTSAINGSPTNSTTINYAAANLATLLDTNANTYLGSGGTHIDTALNSVNGLISGGTGTVGDGSTATTPQPYVFLVTDGAQDNQYQDIPFLATATGTAATMPHDYEQTPWRQYPNACTALKGRGIIVSVLYIPYQQISPVNTSFAGNEDTYANNNIPYIPASLQNARRLASSTPRTRPPTSPRR